MSITRFIVFFFLMGVLLCPSPRAIGQNSKENADFKLAINLYGDGLYDLAAEQLNQFITNFPNSSNGVEARFYLGLTQMKLKRFDDARLTFQSFALTYQDNPSTPLFDRPETASLRALTRFISTRTSLLTLKPYSPPRRATWAA